jgi:large subunit ribosomal protein L22
VANLQQKDGFGGDIDRLYVAEVFANQGMSMKRVRPAPMGRAYRVVKRTAHLTVRVVERPLKIEKVGAGGPAAEGAAKAKTPARTSRAKKAAATA